MTTNRAHEMTLPLPAQLVDPASAADLPAVQSRWPVTPSGLAHFGQTAYSLVLPARWYLGTEAKDDELAKGATDALADELESKLSDLREFAWPSLTCVEQESGARLYGWAGEPDTTVPIEEDDGMLLPDARFAEFLEGFGLHGRKAATELRERARKRWSQFKSTGDAELLWHMWEARRVNIRNIPRAQTPSEWTTRAVSFGEVEGTEELIAPKGLLDTAPRFIIMLTHVVWHDVVRPRRDRAHRKGPPAIPMVVHEPVTHLFSPVRREEERNGQRALRLPGEVLVRISSDAASIGSETINALLVNKGVKLFGSVASHRLLRWQIFTAHRQALEGNPDPRVLRVDGGYSALAHDILGMTGNKAAEQVRNIIEAMHATELPLPPHGNYTRLLIREAHTPRGRGKQWIKLVLGTALLPDYVKELQDTMGKSLEARRATRLVPVLGIPPLIGKESGGRDNEMGAQATFSMLLVAHLRDHARELVQRGGVAIPDDRLFEIARGAKLSEDMARRLIEHWTNDHFDGPALLKRIDGKLYTLGDAHEKERSFIEDGGRRELQGQGAGEKANRKRLSKLRRQGGDF